MDPQKRSSMALLAGCALTLAAGTSRAATDPVVLRIYQQTPGSPKESASKATPSGAAAAPVASYGMAFLKSLPQRSFTTMTPWDKKPIKFTGPLLRDVMAAAKAEGVTLKAMALNDYQTTIPFADIKKFDVVLAHKMNGESIPVKTKGPLFIVYPYDTNKELQSTVYYERSAWQLKSLSID